MGPISPTDPLSALNILKLLADDTRWRLIKELRRSDRQAGELVTQLQLPQNLVSYHLGLLREAGLVQIRRSDADARAIYYHLDIAALQAGLQQIDTDIQLSGNSVRPRLVQAMVVFLCTGNSARSQIAEGWLRHLSGSGVSVRSAGTQPRSLHPLAVQVMAEAGIDIGYHHAKGLETLAGVEPDVVVTVCDLAREQCPDWRGNPTQLHWSIPDPVRVHGSHEAQTQAFRATRDDLRHRVEGLLALLPTLAAADQM
jgi:ArsR family transcriptional regulator, arsenate/arsenite/antimonite-responsive transcriptional repressor / arsenate reductase (thioredoxin)